MKRIRIVISGTYPDVDEPIVESAFADLRQILGVPVDAPEGTYHVCWPGKDELLVDFTFERGDTSNTTSDGGTT